MARLVAFLVLIVAVCTISASILKPYQCGPHETWMECARPESCEATCDHDAAEICPNVCVARCQCQTGYLKNYMNLCVHNCMERDLINRI